MTAGRILRGGELWAVLALLAAAAGCENLPGPGGGGARAGGKFPVVVIETSAGTIRAELWPDKAPGTVDNFLRYVKAGFYDGTIFHRCLPGFMVQGGGFTANWKEKATGPAIKNEADNGLRNLRGTLAMARTSDIHSATSQFFINNVDNSFLDHGQRDFGYAVFGEVVSGMDVVENIEKAPLTGDPSQGRPAEPVVIRSIRLEGAPGGRGSGKADTPRESEVAGLTNRATSDVRAGTPR